MEGSLVQPTFTGVVLRLPTVDANRELAVEIGRIGTQSRGALWRVARFDRGVVTLPLSGVEVLVGHTAPQRNPGHRLEERVAVQVRFLKAEVRPRLSLSVRSQTVVADLCGIAPTQPAAEGEALSQVIPGFRLGFYEFVIQDGVQPFDAPKCVISIVFFVLRSKAHAAPVIDTAHG